MGVAGKNFKKTGKLAGLQTEGSNLLELLELYEFGHLLALVPEGHGTPCQLWTAHKWRYQALNQRCLQIRVGRYCIQHNKS